MKSAQQMPGVSISGMSGGGESRHKGPEAETTCGLGDQRRCHCGWNAKSDGSIRNNTKRYEGTRC